ncbi:hypothetical protein NQ317_003035 [Molorchus minor]|uniref:Complex 1 LYR protein domain-containing protein n=1 Tax=Molorchus minor TaxID=1323400 RepID=A0ABQ9JE14_9CUCU|nr:hypothetical protein NQ317_003035 [Molorchus minor]
MTSKSQILKLYKTLLRESQKFPSYNYRKYSLRMIHDAFQENKNMTDRVLISAQIQEATRNLDIIKRQVVLGQMYSTEKLIIENVFDKV